MLACLERGGLIVATENEQFLPARDLGQIRLISVIDAVRTRHSGRLMIDVRPVPSAVSVMSELETAIDDKLGQRSLKDLIASP